MAAAFGEMVVHLFGHCCVVEDYTGDVGQVFNRIEWVTVDGNFG